MKRLSPAEIRNAFFGSKLFTCDVQHNIRTIVITPKNGKQIATLDVPFLMEIANDRVSYFRATTDGKIEFVIEY